MAKAIRELDGKELLHKYAEKLKSENGVEAQGEIRIPFVCAPVSESTDFDLLVKTYPWLLTEVSRSPCTVYKYWVFFLSGWGNVYVNPIN